jgi:hypothetical protein
MTIGMTARQGKHWGWLVIAAAFGCLSDAPAAKGSDGPTIFNRKPSGPIFKTLDALAGGIELVLEKTVLGHSKTKRGCDAQSCDDGCDAIMLHELNLPQGSKIAVPEAYQPLPPPKSAKQSMPDQSVPPMNQGERNFERPTRRDLPEPTPIPLPTAEVPTPELPPISKTQPPKAVPLTIPKLPANAETQVQKKSSQPDLSTDDGWIDSFAPIVPNRDTAPKRQTPAPVQEALPDPFQDDPQTRSTPRRFSPALRPSEPSHATRPLVRRPVKQVGFVDPD